MNSSLKCGQPTTKQSPTQDYSYPKVTLASTFCFCLSLNPLCALLNDYINNGLKNNCECPEYPLTHLMYVNDIM
jgi:hypothetical protein